MMVRSRWCRGVVIAIVTGAGLGAAGSGAQAQIFARADDTRAIPPEYRERKRLRFEVSAGATLLSGNVDHLALSGKLALAVPLAARHELFLDAAATHSIFDGKALIDKDSGALMYVLALAEHWNLYAVSTHSRNRFRV